MKRYKLLKDLPTFKAGDKFYLDSNNNLRLGGSEIIAYSHITLEKFPNILTDWFEEIPEGNKRWRAEEGDEYHAINWSGSVHCFRDTRQPEDDYRYKTGNYGRTVEELEAKREYDIARQVLLDDAEGGKFVSDHKNIYTIYDYITKELNQTITTYSYIPGAIIFHNDADLEKSLEEHKKQWDIVRKYETGEM